MEQRTNIHSYIMQKTWMYSTVIQSREKIAWFRVFCHQCSIIVMRKMIVGTLNLYTHDKSALH